MEITLTHIPPGGKFAGGYLWTMQLGNKGTPVSSQVFATREAALVDAQEYAAAMAEAVHRMTINAADPGADNPPDARQTTPSDLAEAQTTLEKIQDAVETAAANINQIDPYDQECWKEIAEAARQAADQAFKLRRIASQTAQTVTRHNAAQIVREELRNRA